MVEIVRHERNYGIDSPDYRDLVSTRSVAHLAVQHRLGLLPKRRVGINSVDPDRASVDGKIVKVPHLNRLFSPSAVRCLQPRGRVNCSNLSMYLPLRYIRLK